jgi:hypothetical protein
MLQTLYLNQIFQLPVVVFLETDDIGKILAGIDKKFPSDVVPLSESQVGFKDKSEMAEGFVSFFGQQVPGGESDQRASKECK